MATIALAQVDPTQQVSVLNRQSPAAHSQPTLPSAQAGASVLSHRVVGDIVAAATVMFASAAVWGAVVIMEMLPAPYTTADFQAAAIAIGCLIMFAQFAVFKRDEINSAQNKNNDWVMVAGGALAAGTASFVSTAGAISATSITVSLLLAVIGGLAAGTCRIALNTFVARSPFAGKMQRRVAVYGASHDSARIFKRLAAQDDVKFIGLFESRQDVERQKIIGIPVGGTFDDLEALARAGAVDEIIIALPHWAKKRTETLAAQLAQFPVDVHVPVQNAYDLPRTDRKFHISRFNEIELAHVQASPLRDWSLIAKVAQDRIGGAVLLAALSPIFALIAVAIKLDSAGPVFFRQKRHGLCGREITVWKFRSMRVMENGPVVNQATKNDARITRVGKFLRKSSLDELPQLINVVLGEMSIVGPRPHAIAHNEHYARFVDAYNGRNQMKPGITGWAQVNGYRGETKEIELMEKRVEYDLWYIRNWSLWLDIKIILMTPIYGLVHRNAY